MTDVTAHERAIHPSGCRPRLFYAKFRTIMSSIIRWSKGETLRAFAMDCSKGVLLLMGSNGIPKTSL
jgi:hypothetical protein